MRVGFNPNKDVRKKQVNDFVHQIVIPVYIPELNGYFEKSLKVLELCLNSVFQTIHSKTFITIVNNGSCESVKYYLEFLYQNKQIHELIHTQNIGKVNAILKGIVGHQFPLVTISDADILFKPRWQEETASIFSCSDKIGAVGLIQQFGMYKSNCENIIFENLWNRKIQFQKVKDVNDLVHFYDSIGWKRDYNPHYLDFILGIEINHKILFIGSGHAVTTFRGTIFQEVVKYNPYKLGGDSELYLDRLPLLKKQWRVTTNRNFAYHIGNQPEDWMYTYTDTTENQATFTEMPLTNHLSKDTIWNHWRLKIYRKCLSSKILWKFLYQKWGLPKVVAKNF